MTFNCSDTVANHDRCQRGTITESITTNGSNTIWNDDGC